MARQVLRKKRAGVRLAYASCLRDVVLYSVTFFSPFRIVKTIERSDKITGNTTDAVKGRSLEMIRDADFFALNLKLKSGDAGRTILGIAALDICFRRKHNI